MKRVLWMAILLTASLSAACSGEEDRSPIIAKVNGREVHRAEFEGFLALKIGELNLTAGTLRSRLLDEYLTRRLVLDQAEQAGITISDEEIEQAAHENPQIKSTAATAGARKQLMDDLLIEKYYQQILQRDVRISNEEKQKYIEDNLSRMTDRPVLYVREIRVQSREEAERFRNEVTEGHRDFAAVARLHSDAPTAERGGLTKYEEGQLPAVLEKAIRPLRPGDVSAVVESTYGFHVFKLEHRAQPRSPDERRSQYDERRSQLAEELTTRKNQQAVDEEIARLTASARIQIIDSSLGFTYEGQFRHN